MLNEELAKAAIAAALKSGEILRKGFGTSFEISNKEGKNNLVTEFDKLSESLIIDELSKKYPDSTFLAEESGISGEENKEKIRWIIDPLDGTVNFAHSLPIFSISIAAELNSELLCGVIYNPILDELFVGISGMGAWRNEKPLRVSETKDFDSSYLVTGFPYNVSNNPCHCIDIFVSIIQRGIPVRRLGSAALDLAYVAAGIFDGFWEIDLNPWDVAAGVVLVREAGGIVSQFNNFPFNINDNTILATNGLIHGQAVNLLQSLMQKISINIPLKK